MSTNPIDLGPIEDQPRVKGLRSELPTFLPMMQRRYQEVIDGLPDEVRSSIRDDVVEEVKAEVAKISMLKDQDAETEVARRVEERLKSEVDEALEKADNKFGALMRLDIDDPSSCAAYLVSESTCECDSCETAEMVRNVTAIIAHAYLEQADLNEAQTKAFMAHTATTAAILSHLMAGKIVSVKEDVKKRMLLQALLAPLMGGGEMPGNVIEVSSADELENLKKLFPTPEE